MFDTTFAFLTRVHDVLITKLPLVVHSHKHYYVDDCFSCLPPYAGWLTSTEKANYDSFVQALRGGYVQLQSVNDDRVTQWVSAYGNGGVTLCCII
jgi:hypothetical protein